jgi:hypothetical protein
LGILLPGCPNCGRALGIKKAGEGAASSEIERWQGVIYVLYECIEHGEWRWRRGDAYLTHPATGQVAQSKPAVTAGEPIPEP